VVQALLHPAICRGCSRFDASRLGIGRLRLEQVLRRLHLQLRLRLALSVAAVGHHPHPSHLHAGAKAAGFAQRALLIDPGRGLYLRGALQGLLRQAVTHRLQALLRTEFGRYGSARSQQEAHQHHRGWPCGPEQRPCCRLNRHDQRARACSWPR
jgi:hypothetical protein